MLSGNKIPCPYCEGFVEELEEDDQVVHRCIHCAREMDESFICHTVFCRWRR